MDNKLTALPSCPTCNVQLEYRPPGTKEQAWCGAWYDCPKCRHYTVLITSTELEATYEEYYTRHPEKRPKGWHAKGLQLLNILTNIATYAIFKPSNYVADFYLSKHSSTAMPKNRILSTSALL